MTPFSENLDQDDLIRQLISRVLHSIRNQKSREQVASEMRARLGGRRVTVAMLNDFTRSTTGSRFPARWIQAFCDVTGSEALLLLVAGERFGKAERLRMMREVRNLQEIARRLESIIRRRTPWLISGSVSMNLLAATGWSRRTVQLKVQEGQIQWRSTRDRAANGRALREYKLSSLRTEAQRRFLSQCSSQPVAEPSAQPSASRGETGSFPSEGRF